MKSFREYYEKRNGNTHNEAYEDHAEKVGEFIGKGIDALGKLANKPGEMLKKFKHDSKLKKGLTVKNVKEISGRGESFIDIIYSDGSEINFNYYINEIPKWLEELVSKHKKNYS